MKAKLRQILTTIGRNARSLRGVAFISCFVLFAVSAALVISLVNKSDDRGKDKTHQSQVTLSAGNFTISNPSKIQNNAGTLRLIDLGGGTYATDAPYVTSTNPISYVNLGGFTQQLGGNNVGQVTYRLSPDGTNWYWWNGSGWAPISLSNTIDDANTAAELNDHMDEFATQFGAGNVYVRAFFRSNGTQQVELQNVTLSVYSSPAPTVSNVNPAFGAVAGGTNVTITGTNFGADLTPVDTTTNSWTSAGTTTNGANYRSLAVIGDKVYLFGGYSSTNIIYSAPLSDPTNMTNTNKTLPGSQCCTQVAVIGDYVYMFGGYTTPAIWRAPVSDPTSWSATGASMPATNEGVGFYMVGNMLYYVVGTDIYSASSSNPLAWTNTGKTISGATRYPLITKIGSNLYLYSGNKIHTASTSTPTIWTDTGKTLPATISSSSNGSQLGIIGDKLYIYNSTNVLSASTSDPTTWTNTGITLPGNMGNSSWALIGSKMYLYSGTAIYSAPVTGTKPNVYNLPWLTDRPTVGPGLQSISFGGVPATNVQTLNSTTATATAPAHAAGVVDVTVTGYDGQTATLTNGFTYIPPPTISGVSPPSGSTAGGESVTLSGSGFVSGATVKFGVNAATNVTVVNSTTITLTTPAGTASSVDVTVTNPDNQTYTYSNGYTYLDPPPQATSVSPTGGPAIGGTNVTINGTGFIPPNKTDNTWATVAGKTLPGSLQLSAMAVVGDKIYLYGGFETSAIYVANVSDPSTWTSTGKTLPDAIYGAQVAVVGSKVYLYGGNGSAGKIYSANVSDPATVTATGKTLPGNSLMYGSQIAVIGSKMYLYGSYSAPDTQKIFSANTSDPTTWTDETTVNGKTLPGAMGFATLTIVKDKVYLYGGSSNSAIYYANTSDPTTWYTATGKTFTSGGSFGQSAVIGDYIYYYAGTSTNRIYAAPVSDPTTWTDTGKSIPVTLGRSQMALINDKMWLFGGQSSNQIFSAPLTQYRPNMGNRTWMTNWANTVNPDQSGITFGGIPATNVTFVSPTQVTATTPAHAAGLVDVVVSNYDGQPSTLTNSFNYFPPPEILDVIPDSGTMAGGDTITMTGNNFQNGATVMFGDAEAASVVYIDEHTLMVTTPAQVPISVDVTITNPDGQKDVLPGGFTFLAPPPVVADVSPVMGPMAGGTEVTISGSGFVSQNTTTNQWSTGPSSSAARWGSPAVVIGDTIYKFGGGVNTNTATAAIYTAPVSSPTNWTNTGKNVPSLAVGAQFAVIGDTIYMFGGNAASPLNTIFSAPVSDPTTWTNTGKTLPAARYFGQLAVVGDTIYLYGGFSGHTNGSAIDFSSSTNTIFSAPVSDPTTWTNTGLTLPSKVAGSQLITIGDTMYMYGGHNGTSGIDTIFSASTATPMTWTSAGSLPEARYGATLAAIGSKLYLYGGSGASGSQTIYVADASSPATMTLTEQTLPLSTEFASFMTIDNRIYLAGSVSYAQFDSAPINRLGANFYNQPWTTNWLTSAPTIDQSNVSFGGVSASDVTFVSTTEIKAVTPPHSPGLVGVTVTNADGQNYTLNDAFTYLPDAYAFTNAPLNVAATEPGALTIQARDENGNPVTSTEDITLQLTTSSGSGFFARDLNEDESTRWSYDSVVLPAGQSSVTFYYKDNFQGTPTITVKDPNNTQVQQQQTIGPRYKLLVTGITDPVQSGVPSSITVQAVDYQGQPQTDYTGTIHFTSGDASALLPSDFTFTSEMLGLHTFVNGATMRSQGEWCVTATDTVSASITGSQCDITVTPPNAGTISKLKIITQPQSFPADGHSSAITVQTQDVNGLPIPVASDTTIYVYSDSGTGQFSTNGESGWASGSPYPITIKAGTTSANVYYKDTTTGTHTITMRDDAGTGTDFGWTNDSQSITVGVGDPSQLGVTAGSIAAAGEWVPVTVHLQDSVGNDVTSFKNVSVHMTSNSTTARFSADPSGGNPVAALDTLIPAGSATATFYVSDITAGQLILTATDSSPPGNDPYDPGDTTITVGPGEPVAIGFLPVPDPIRAGEPKQLAAYLKDIYGNTAIATDPVNVTFTTTGVDGGFSTNTAGPWASSTNIVINTGASTAPIYYRDTTVGNPAITASTVEFGDAQLNLQVIAGPYNGKLGFKSAPTQFTAGVAQTIQVELLDDYGNPTIADNTVPLIINSSSLTGEFSLSGVSWSPTISPDILTGQGDVTVLYRDTKAGSITLGAQENSKPATRITYTPMVVAAAPAKYVYTSNSQIIAKNAVSNPIAIELQDQYNNPASAPNGFSATINTTSVTGEFSLNGTSGWTNSSLSIPFATGASSATVRYRDSINGTYALTTSGNGLTAANQNIRVVEGVPGRIVLSSAGNVTAGESIAVALKTQTSSGIDTPVLEDTTFDLSGVGEFSLTESPWTPVTSVTLNEGESETILYYRSTQAGINTVTAQESPSQGWTEGNTDIVVGGAEVYRFGFTTKPANVPVTEASGVFTVSTLDIYGNVTSPSSDTTAYLYTTAGTGTFSTNTAGPWSTDSVTIPAGGNSATFYYRDTTLGTPTITASDKSPLESPDEDILNAITPVDVIGQQASKLVFTTSPQTITAGGLSSVITIQLQKSDNTPAIQDGDRTFTFWTGGGGDQLVYLTEPDMGSDPVTEITIPRGQSSVSYYVTGSIAGEKLMDPYTYSFPGVGLMEAKQYITVNAATPEALVFTTTPQTIHAGEDSDQMKVELRDTFGNRTTSTTDITVNFASSCGAGQFSLGSGGAWNPVTSAIIPAGQDGVYFYYRDLAPATCTMTVSATDLTPAQQNIEVIYSAAVALDFTSTPQTIVAGQNSSAITVSTKDIYGNIAPVDTDTTVYFSSSSVSGQFSQNSVIIPAGQSSASVTYRDTKPGHPILQARDQAGATDTGLSDATQGITITAGTPTKFAYVPDTFNVVAGQLQSLKIELHNEYDVPYISNTNKTINLSSTVADGEFRASNNAGAPTITQTTIPAGDSSVTVYYRQTTAAVASLSAVDPDTGLGTGTALGTVFSDALKGMRFVTSPQTLEGNQPSSAMTVAAIDEFGNTTAFAPTPMTLYLYSNSPTGKFYTDAGMTNEVTSVTVNTSNTPAFTFYYRDTKLGASTITVSDRSPLDNPDVGIQNATQTVTIVPGVPAKLGITGGLPELERGGADGPDYVVLRNAYDFEVNASSDQVTYLSSSSATGEFATSASGPWQSTLMVVIPSGQSRAEFYYRDDTTLGAATMTVSDVSAPPETPDTGLINGTKNITVISGAFAQLTFTTAPQTITARHPSNIMTVEALNRYGKPTAVTANTTIYLRSNAATGEFATSASGPWGISSMVIPANDSTVSFYYRDSKEGTPTLRASNSLSTNPSEVIAAAQQQTIERQVLSHFLVTNISDPQYQGNPSSVVVAAVDSDNFVIDWYDGTVSFSASDGNAVLPGSYTFNPSKDKGIHTFVNGVAFKSAGEKTVTATDTNGITGQQANITVLGNPAGAPAKLVFMTPPSPLSVAKNQVSEVITIQVQDSANIPTNAGPGGFPVRLTSNADTGEFATSPSGPWQAAATFNVPEGLNYLNLYYRDSAVGQPQITARDWTGGVDNPAIANATLDVIVNALQITSSQTTSSQNFTNTFVSNPLFFAYNESGSVIGRASFTAESHEERNGAARPVNWLLTWKNGAGITLGQQTADNTAQISYNPSDVTAQPDDDPFVLDIQATDPNTDEISGATRNVNVSPWQAKATAPSNYTVGTPLTVQIESRQHQNLADATQGVVEILNSSLQPIGSQVLLTNMQHTGTGTYDASLLSPALTEGQTYYALVRLLDPSGDILAEDLSSSFQAQSGNTSGGGENPGSENGGGTTNPSNPNEGGSSENGGTSTGGQPDTSGNKNSGDTASPNQNNPSIGGNQNDSTEDDIWLISSLGKAFKKFFSSPAAPIIVSNSLFGFVIAMAVILLWQAYKELRQVRLLIAILEREKRTAEDKDNFLQLCAHYLRTPITIIAASSEMLAAKMGAVYAESTQTLTTVVKNLQQKTEQLVTQTTSDQNLQAIVAPNVAIERRKLYRNPMFWMPIILSIVLTVLGNWAASSIGNQSVHAAVLLQQVAVAIIAVILLYTGLRLRAMRRKRKEMLAAALRRRAELDQAKNQFVTNTYDLLAGDVYLLAEIQKKLPDEEKFVTMLGDGTKRLEKLMDKFKLLATVDTTQIHVSNFTTTQLVNQVLGEFADVLKAKEITVDRHGRSIMLQQDAALFERVVNSVLANAIEFNNNGGTIDVATKQTKDAVIMNIRDNGPGFRQDPEQLFEAFKRGDDSLDFTHEGIGLDLYLDRLIMRHLGGTISAHNISNKGAKVSLTLPNSINS